MNRLEKVTRQFAVGCFHFADVRDEFPEFDVSEYRIRVAKFLESIENITDIEVSEFRSVGVFDARGVYDLRDKPMPSGLVIPGSGRVSFNIYIPKRSQSEVFKEARLNCERFRVVTNYDSGFPVTIVESLERIPIDYGFTDFVPIIRQYIRKRNPEHDGIRFLCWGPSPFHADFLFEVDPEYKGEAHGEVRQDKRLGYDDIFYKSSEDSDEEYNNFKKIVVANAGIFYELEDLSNKLSLLEAEASMEMTAALDRLTEVNPVKRIWRNLFNSNKRALFAAYQAILEIEEEAESAHERFQRHSEALYGEGLGSELLGYAEEILDQLPTNVSSKLSGAARLIELFETSRSNNSAVLLAGLLSAVIAATATLAAQALFSRRDGVQAFAPAPSSSTPGSQQMRRQSPSTAPTNP